jgi:hypothetical protein
MTVMIQREGLMNLTSMTKSTNPVTSDPSTVTAVCWPRCWSLRQRLAIFGSVVSNVCMLTKSRHAKRYREDPVGSASREAPTISAHHRQFN